MEDIDVMLACKDDICGPDNMNASSVESHLITQRLLTLLISDLESVELGISGIIFILCTSAGVEKQESCGKFVP